MTLAPGTKAQYRKVGRAVITAHACPSRIAWVRDDEAISEDT